IRGDGSRLIPTISIAEKSLRRRRGFKAVLYRRMVRIQGRDVSQRSLPVRRLHPVLLAARAARPRDLTAHRRRVLRYRPARSWPTGALLEDQRCARVPLRTRHHTSSLTPRTEVAWLFHHRGSQGVANRWLHQDESTSRQPHTEGYQDLETMES